MIPVYQYLNQQSLTVTSVQRHVPTPPPRFPTELKAVVLTESSASHKETEVTICDYRGALEFWSTNC